MKPSIICVLASGSPRRRRLLQRFLPEMKFRVVKGDVREERSAARSVRAAALRNARRKAAWAVRQRLKNRAGFIVIAADTVISFQGRMIGQPATGAAAGRILARLSGKKHRVITGVVLWARNRGSEDRVIEFSDTSDVWMKKLSRQEIAAYIRTGEPMDKAGAYAIQGRGGKFIENYSGSYTNIVGLPVEKMRKIFYKLMRMVNGDL